MDDPDRWWKDASNSTRKRRGLFDFVGNASHFLFGTATSDEVARVQATLRQLGRNQGRIQHDVLNFASVIDHTFNEINKTRQMMREITDYDQRAFKQTNQALQTVQTWLNAFAIRHAWDTNLHVPSGESTGLETSAG